MKCMKYLVFVLLVLGLTKTAMAQQPTTADTTGQEEHVMTVEKNKALSQKTEQQSAVTVIEPESMVLKAGVENEVRLQVKGVSVGNMILKVVNEESCNMRKGGEAGAYYFTPKVEEGVVIVRVGAMDFMGAFYKLADIEFKIE